MSKEKKDTFILGVKKINTCSLPSGNEQVLIINFLEKITE